MTSDESNGIFQLNYNQFLIWQQALPSGALLKTSQQIESLSSHATDSKGQISKLFSVNLILNTICFVMVIANFSIGNG